MDHFTSLLFLLHGTILQLIYFIVMELHNETFQHFLDGVDKIGK
jgi:hypothetical protein